MIIRKMIAGDREEVLSMMRLFYASPAVLTNGSEQVFQNDIDACISDSPYAEGYVFAEEDAVLGYAMIAKSYSTEFGKFCIWIEDLYVKPPLRGQGIGTAFFNYLEQAYPDHLFRLEVEEENHRALHVYEKNGFTVLPYMEMIKEDP